MSGKLITFDVKKWTVFGRTVFQPPFKISDALINEARIVHVVNGKSKLYSANQYVDLKSGDTVIMKTDNFVNNWLVNEDDSMTQVIVFQLNADFLQYLYNGERPPWYEEKIVTVSSAVESVKPHFMIAEFYENISKYVDSSDYLTEELVELKTKELLSILVQTDKTGSIKNILANLFTATEYEFQETIQKHLFEELNVEELAFLSGMSLSSFKRKFNSIYGTSPNKYIVSKRLEKAQNMLVTSDLHISEIAYACGFSDLSHFSKTFRKYYNTSPSEARKNILG